MDHTPGTKSDQQECFNGCSKNLIYAPTFIHLIHNTYLHNNSASFYNDNNNFLNGKGKIKYCRGFSMNGVTLIYRAIIQIHSQAKKTRRNESLSSLFFLVFSGHDVNGYIDSGLFHKRMSSFCQFLYI